MKSTRILLALFVLTGIFHHGYCASGLLDGYYITLHGDTVYCKVGYADRSFNPKTVTVEVNHEKRTFGVEDIRGFGIRGYADYESSPVTYHTNPIKGSGLPEEFSEKTETGTFFLKRLATGYYSLYELNFSVRSYYFIKEQDSVLAELVYRVKEKDGVQEEDLQYRKTIFTLFAKEGLSTDYFDAIERSFYSGSDLKLLVARMNRNHSGQEKQPLRTKRNKIQIALFAGGIVNTFPQKVKGEYTSLNFDHSVSPTGGFNLSYVIPSRFNSFSLGFSLGYNQYSFSAGNSGTFSFYESANYYGSRNWQERIFSANSMIMGDIYASWVINPLAKLKFFVKVGLYGCVSLSNSRDIYSEFNYNGQTVANGLPPVPSDGNGSTTLIHVKHMFPAFNLGGGVMSGRSRVELSYSLPTQLSSDLGLSFTLSMIGLRYYYTVFR